MCVRSLSLWAEVTRYRLQERRRRASSSPAVGGPVISVDPGPERTEADLAPSPVRDVRELIPH